MEARTKSIILEEGARVYQEIRELEHTFKQTMLASQGLFQGACQEGANKTSGRSPLHAYYPLLFSTAFPEVHKDLVRKLCWMERIYTEHLLAYDRILDQTERFDPLMLFMAHLKQMHGLRDLYVFFAHSHPFWSTFQECYLHAWKAILQERLHHFHRILPYDVSEFEYIATGKTALCKVFSLALAFLSGRVTLDGIVSSSLDGHHMGLILLDDLEDWKEDYVRGHFTFPLTRLILENDLRESVLNGRKPPVEAVGRILYRTGIADEQVRQAEVCFQRAVECAHGVELPLWIEFNREYIQRCRSMRKELMACRGQESVRSSTPVYSLVSECGDIVPQPQTREAPPDHEHRPSAPEVVLQPGTVPACLDVCVSVLRQCNHRLCTHGRLRFFIGVWPAMPAHFIIPQDKDLLVGIQLNPGVVPIRSTDSRPLEAELILAYVEAVRFQVRGPVRRHLEHIVVAGIGLLLCHELCPGHPQWEQLGMNHLDWQWCQKNEWLLWEALRQEQDKEPCATERGCVPLDPLRFTRLRAPHHAHMYIALRTAQVIIAHSNDTDVEALLMKIGPEEIVRVLDQWCL